MKRRLLRIFIPILLIFGITLSAWHLIWHHLEQNYLEQSNYNIAVLIGSIAEANPEVDQSAIIKALRGNPSSPEQAEAGFEILQSYGLLPEDYATPDLKDFGHEISLVLILLLALTSILVLSYFWYQDYRTQQHIRRLVRYLQDLKDRIYDLRLDENSEDELSLLTNEIYKITVLLKESAENNRRHSQNLETALADISHQLRTPLTSLQVMVDNIYDDPEMLVDVRQDFLRSIRRELGSISDLISTLLHLAKFDNGSIKLQRQTTTVRELFQSVCQNLAILADLHDIELRLTGDLDAKITLDSRWQVEALTNIVKNCIEHSPSGSRVILSSEDCPLFLRLNIKDFGEGISPEDQRHIFERFYKAKGSTKDSIGIGLAFAKTVIEADNGQISVHSTPGSGSTFTINYFK